MQRLIFSLIFTFYFIALHGQTSFNILPDVGGINKQGMGLLGITDSLSIIIIGHRYDTVLPGPNAKPYLANFDYYGQLQYVVPIKDSIYNKPFNISTNAALVRKNDSVYYFAAQRDIGGLYFQPYLMELNITSGKILRSSIVINEDNPLLSYEGGDINYIDSNTLLFLNTLTKSDSIISYYTLFDSLLNEIKAVKIKTPRRKSFAVSGKMVGPDLFMIIGYCLVEGGPQGDYYQYYADSVDGNGNVLVHTLAPTTIPISRGVYGTNTIIQDIDGNWIIGGTSRKAIPDLCADCYELIPYIFSTTPDFKTLRWQTKYFDVPYYGAPQYFLYSMTQVEDGYIVSGDFFNYEGFDSGVLFKGSNHGDSLWMKHYIPLSWEEERVASVRFFDIQTAPYGTIVVTGAIGDFQENIIRPWILHLDKDGCIVPDCNVVGTKTDGRKPDKQFTIYPNPVNEELYLLSSISLSEKVEVKIISGDGIIVKSTTFLPVEGYQYIMQLRELIPGAYHLVFSIRNKGILESHSFVKL